MVFSAMDLCARARLPPAISVELATSVLSATTPTSALNARPRPIMATTIPTLSSSSRHLFAG